MTTIDPRTAHYLRISSLTDDIVVSDRNGTTSSFGSAAAYEAFITGVSAHKQTLYDDTTKQWVVGSIGHLDPV